MTTLDWCGYAYCEDCNTSIDFYKTDLTILDQSQQNINENISYIFKKPVKSKIIERNKVIMSECVLTRSMQLIQEFLVQAQLAGKIPQIDQHGSNIYALDNDTIVIDLIINENIWYSIINGSGWWYDNKEHSEQKGLMDMFKSMFNFGG